MNDFKKIKLGDLAEIQTGPFGSQLHQKDYVENGIPLVTVKNLGERRISRHNLDGVSDEDAERLSKYRLKEGDIVFSRVGYIDRSSLVFKEEVGWMFASSTLVARPNKELVLPDYLIYYLKTPSFKRYIDNVAVGATRPSLNTKILSECEINIPEINTQKDIAQILGRLDDKIELNRQMNETLEAMAQALFKSWFVDFDPVIDNALASGHAIPDALRLKAEKRKRVADENKLLNKNPKLAAQFPNRFEYNETLGKWIPEGWEVKSVNDVTTKSNTGADAIQKAPIVNYDTGVRCVRVGDFTNNRDFSFWGFSEVTDENYEKYSLKKGDILVTRTSALGLSKLINENIRSVYNNGLIRIQVNIPPEIVFQMFRSDQFMTYIDRIGGESSTRPNMKINYLLGYNFVMPIDDMLNQAAKLFSDFNNRIDHIRNQNQILMQLRDTLLPQLINGKVRVPSTI